MDNASDYGSEDCRFESCQGRFFFLFSLMGYVFLIHYNTASKALIGIFFLPMLSSSHLLCIWYCSLSFQIQFHVSSMVYDQHSGRPKGFAFCEYQDVETAQSALRNLHEQMLNGRPLKLDSAANAPDDRFKGT